MTRVTARRPHVFRKPYLTRRARRCLPRRGENINTFYVTALSHCSLADLQVAADLYNTRNRTRYSVHEFYSRIVRGDLYATVNYDSYDLYMSPQHMPRFNFRAKVFNLKE